SRRELVQERGRAARAERRLRAAATERARQIRALSLLHKDDEDQKDTDDDVQNDENNGHEVSEACPRTGAGGEFFPETGGESREGRRRLRGGEQRLKGWKA